MADIFDEMKKIQEEMEILFREMSHFEHSYTLEENQVYHPPMNVYYNKKNIVVMLELAGVDRDALSVDVSEKLLIVKGERNDPFGKSSGNYYTLEIYFGRFERWVHLPFPVEKAGIRIEFDNGLIKITLQRKKKREKIIPIE